LIRKTADSIERKLLTKFATESKRNKISNMKVLAETLCNFQSPKVIDQYIDRVMKRMPDPEEELKGLAGIPPSVFSDKSKQFFDRMLRECREQFSVIGRVFPVPSLVCLRILKRMFNNIRAFIQLSVSRSNDIEDYLKVLEEAHKQTEKAAGHFASLRKDLIFPEGVDVKTSVRTPTTNSQTLGRIRASLAHVQSTSLGTPLSSPIETRREMNWGRADDFKFKESVENIFNPFREEYLGKEVKLLERYCKAIIDRAIRLDEKEREDLDDKSLFGRRKKGAKGSRALKRWVLNALDAMAAAGCPPSPVSDSSAKSKRLPQGKLSDDFEGETVVEKVLNVLGAAIERSKRLGNDIPVSCDRLSKEVWTLLLEKYISVALDLAEEVLPDDVAREEPDTRFFFRATGAINRIIHIMTNHYRKHVLPNLEADPNTKSRADSFNRNSLRRIENRLLRGIKICLRSVMFYSEKILQKYQRPSDFRPRDELLCFECTEACHQVSAFIAVQAEAAVESLQGRNLDAYLAELGRRFYQVVVCHLRKFSVSPLGAMLVAQDTRKFQDVVHAFHIEEVSLLFSQLRDMTSLLMLPVEQLGMVVQQRLNTVPVEELHTFLKIRSDYAKQRIQILNLLNL